MFNPLSIDAPYSSIQFIDNMVVYATCKGCDEMLDLVREIQESGNYYWQGLAFPMQGGTTFTSQQTKNGTVQIPPGTYITSISYFNDTAPGFKFKIYDKGTKASIFYGDYCKSSLVSSDMQIQSNPADVFVPSDPGMNSDDPFGPGYLMSPFIITDPGVLGWEIVNMATANATIQVLMACAVPINSTSIGGKVITKG
jgi:hypothetical protein